MSAKITKAELEQQYHMLQEEYGRLSHGFGELKTKLRQKSCRKEDFEKIATERNDLNTKCCGLMHELEGVRGALTRQSELREKAEADRDEYKKEMVRWKNEAGDYHNKLDGIRIENDLLNNFKDCVDNIMRKRNTLTLEHVDNALKQWNYIDDKLSHGLCMPLESLIQLLDEYGVNDFCKLRERLMYGPTTDYINALDQVKKLEKENKELEHLANDLEKQRRELEDWKAGRENDLKSVFKKYDEYCDKAWKWDKVHELVNAHGIYTMSKLKDALVELEHKREDVESLKTSLADSCSAKIKEGRDLTSKIESLKEDLKKMTSSRDWYVKEAAKLRGWYDNLKKLYDKARKEGEDGCAMWREDSWKNRDERDRYKKVYEAAARKNDELQCEVNRLTQKVQDFEKRLPGTYLALPQPDDEICGRKIKEWMGYHAVLVKYGIPSPESLDAKLDPFEPARLTATKSYNVMKNWCVNDEKDLDDKLGLLSRYRDVMEKYGVGGPEELDKCLDQRQRMNHTLHALKKDIEQFNQP